MEIILTGRKVTADVALGIGLCEKVVPGATEEMAHVSPGFRRLRQRLSPERL
ncbi:enoyl-CoA hydratase/carnithine racemase [Bradyrhizobium sp. USDA 4451]